MKGLLFVISFSLLIFACNRNNESVITTQPDYGEINEHQSAGVTSPDTLHFWKNFIGTI